MKNNNNTVTFAPIDLNDQKTREHLARHFTDSMTPGSKFLFSIDSDESKELINAINRFLEQTVETTQKIGREPGRLELTVNFSSLPIDANTEGGKALLARQTVATDCLVRKSDLPEDAVLFDALRDEKDVVHMALSENPAETYKITIIAGPYGPTGKWGIYTFHPGNLAPMFPNERMPEAVLREAKKFWEEDYVMVATPVEAAKMIIDYREKIAYWSELENEYQGRFLMTDSPCDCAHMTRAGEMRSTLYGYKNGTEAAVRNYLANALVKDPDMPSRPAITAPGEEIKKTL